LRRLFHFRGRSALLVDDLPGAFFTDADDFSVSSSAFVDDFQCVVGNTLGIQFRCDFGFQLVARLALGKGSTNLPPK
jgi:hypothetical protein